MPRSLLISCSGPTNGVSASLIYLASFSLYGSLAKSWQQTPLVRCDADQIKSSLIASRRADCETVLRRRSRRRWQNPRRPSGLARCLRRPNLVRRLVERLRRPNLVGGPVRGLRRLNPVGGPVRGRRPPNPVGGLVLGRHRLRTYHRERMHWHWFRR